MHARPRHTLLPRPGLTTHAFLTPIPSPERSLLVKLKTECGYQFTSKLESMFTDVKTSRDMMAEFRAHPAACAGNLELDLSVQVSKGVGWVSGQGGWGCCGAFVRVGEPALERHHPAV